MVLKKNSRNIIRIKGNVRNYFREIDVTLIAIVVILSLFSLINMYGLSQADSNYFTKQATYVGIGLALMVLFSFFDYRYLKNYSLPVMSAYIFAIFLLVLTFYSRSIRGVNSWIVLGNYTFEPSELAKLVMIILMAKYFSQRHIHINQLKHLIVSGLYFGIPLGIILVQPDLGSAIILCLIWLGMLIAAGIGKKNLVLLIIIGLIMASIGWSAVLKPYQKERVVAFLNPYDDPLNSDYNLIQSQIAIGSGHIFGKGFANGSQVNLGFLPEPYNDFVFASIAEQFGLFSIVLVLIFILSLISRIIDIGRRTSSNFGKLFSVGLAIFIFSHTLVGAGVNIGIMPITGLPFPFLSYGGSNYISLMIGLGIVQSIKRYG